VEYITTLYIPSAISALITAAFTFFCSRVFSRWNKRIKEKEAAEDAKEMQRQAEQEAIRAGLQAVLRDRIIERYSHYEEKGRMPVYAMENVTKMYEAYHGLGGNGTITKLYNELMKLPHE
jgi:hypothetical protein